MINELKTLAKQQRDNLTFVSIDMIQFLRKDWEKFKDNAELNETQKWALGRTDFKGIPPKTSSIIIAAIPDCVKTKVVFMHHGKEYRMSGTAAKSVERSRAYIMNAVAGAGYAIKVVKRLPLKRLAVQSGLAEYGKNNIAYVSGMGNYLILEAYATNLLCEKGAWREPVVSPICADCHICTNICPSGAIDKDRFLLDSQRCKKCSKCRAFCPMNANGGAVDIIFSEAETEIVLGGAPYRDISKELESKIYLLGLDSQDSAPPYLRELFDLRGQ